MTLQNITPGGVINQPIDIDKLNHQRREQSEGILRYSYGPPSDWTTGIFGCAEDKDSCMTGLFCPCVLFGGNMAAIDDTCSPWRTCVGHAVLVEGNIACALGIITAAYTGVMVPRAFFRLIGCAFGLWWSNILISGAFRGILQKKYHLKNAPGHPAVVHGCLHWCAICQEHRERMNHLCEETTSRSTVIHPPRVQEMNAANKHDQPSSSSSSSPDQDGHNNLNLQSL